MQRLLGTLMLALATLVPSAIANSAEPNAAALITPATRVGSHDFDFLPVRGTIISASFASG